MKRYFSVSDYYKNIFKSKVYKISLDAGCTCPTRDGTKGFGGCIFCSASGSGDFASSRGFSIQDQIQQAKTLVSKKLKNPDEKQKYIAYFQNFTNTYGDPEVLEKKYKEALMQPEIVGLSIATRPDCLNDDILCRIASIAEKTYVSIELGLQTSNERTVDFIRRQYPNQDYEDAIRRIHKINKNIHVVTHIIFGLPEETEVDMMESVKFSVQSGTDGIKFTVLHILQNTDLEKIWREGKISCLSEAEYFLLLEKALSIVPKNIVIHRLTGDGAKKILLAPLWTANKRKVLNDLNHFFEEKDVNQGKNLIKR